MRSTAEWGKTIQSVGDKHAAIIKRSYLSRVSKTKSATDWNVVENTISQGAVAVYYAIHWTPWNPAKQITPAYNEMYSKSNAYLTKLTVKKEAVSLQVNENSFTMPNPAAEAWLLDYAGTEITQLSSQDLKMVRAVLAEGLKQKMTYKQTAKMLQSSLGLNEPQYKAWQKYRDNLKVSESRKAQLSESYYNKLLKYRAETIALTESHTATNHAWTDSVDAYVRNGTLNPSEYEYYWLVAADERMCDQCGGMSGETTPVTSRSFMGGDFPPTHPRCRCTAVLQEKRSGKVTEAPKITPGQEEAAIKGYASQDYEDINYGLRHGGQPNEQVKALDSLMSKSTLRGDEVLFRGLANKELTNKAVAGTIIKDPGFVSTTTDRNVAMSFLDIAASERNTTGILMEIRAPKGMNAIKVTDHVFTETAKREKEYVLARGSEFLVKRAQKLVMEGREVIKLTMVPNITKGLIRLTNAADVVKAESHVDKFVDDGDGLILTEN